METKIDHDILKKTS